MSSYKDRIDAAVRRVELAKTEHDKKIAVARLEALKTYINAKMFNKREMDLLS